MTQFSFVFNPLANGAETWQAELDALKTAVSLITVKELAHQLDVTRSAIDDALAERKTENGTEKRWASKWTHVLCAMLMQRGDQAALDALEKIVEAHTLGTPFIVDELDYSDAEVEAAQRVVDNAKRRRARAQKRGKKAA